MQSLFVSGKIVVAGARNVFTQTDDAMVARLLPGGGLDPTFGTGGVFVYDDGAEETWPTRVVRQPDGKLLVSVAVIREGQSASRVDILRLDGAGHLDSTFGSGGVAAGPEGFIVSTQLADLALQPDGKILVVSNTESSPDPASAPDLRVIRCLADGTPDPSFGTAGVALVDFSTPGDPRSDFANAVAVLPDGRILVGGFGVGFGPSEGLYGSTLARLPASGSLDPTFGVGGLVKTTDASDPLARSFPFDMADPARREGRGRGLYLRRRHRRLRRRFGTQPPALSMRPSGMVASRPSGSPGRRTP